MVIDMSLIDADALKLSMMLIAPGETKKYCYPCKEVLEAIENAPTIEERKTGKWIQDPKSKRYRCNQCLSAALKTDDGQENLSDFCPVCGSAMEGEQP